MEICILSFLKSGSFGNRSPRHFSELLHMYGKPDEVFSDAKMFTTLDEINRIEKNIKHSLPVVAGYGDIQFHFHQDQQVLIVCNYSFNRIPESRHFSSDHFSLSNAHLLKGNMRLAKFLEKMTKNNVDIADIRLSYDKIIKTRFMSVRTVSGIEVNFYHENGAKDFRLGQFVKATNPDQVA